MPISINDEKITGEIVASTSASTPVGYLNCNGATISRTAFSSLFAVIGTTYGIGNGSTTFNLPDLRGQFLRGLDGGRGVDTGRALGSAQSAQNLSHSHTVNSHNHGGGSHTHNYSDNYMVHLGSGSLNPSGGVWGPTNYTFATGSPNSTVISSETPGTNANGGTDLRPANVAVNYFIKF